MDTSSTSLTRSVIDQAAELLARKRIVMINDDDDILELYELLLDEAGYDTTTMRLPFTRPEEIVALRPDLIVLDLKFGTEYHGWIMLDKLRLYRPTAKIPLLLCTAARREVVEVEDHLGTQGVRVVYKPFDIDDFLQAVRERLTPQTPTPEA